MAILNLDAWTVNPDPVNPRDGWPDWVDSDRWSQADDGPRPTAGPDFLPSADDEREAAVILNPGDDGSSDAELDARALDAYRLDVICSGLLWL